MIFKHMDRIVFAGDSVTDMESAQPVGEGLFENVGKSYVRIVENMLSGDSSTARLCRMSRYLRRSTVLTSNR